MPRTNGRKEGHRSTTNKGRLRSVKRERQISGLTSAASEERKGPWEGGQTVGVPDRGTPVARRGSAWESAWDRTRRGGVERSRGWERRPRVGSSCGDRCVGAGTRGAVAGLGRVDSAPPQRGLSVSQLPPHSSLYPPTVYTDTLPSRSDKSVS